MDKEKFLTRVRDALVRNPISYEAPRNETWQPLAEIANDRAALIARFMKELSAVGGKAERVSQEKLVERIGEIAREWKAQNVAVGSALDEELKKKFIDWGLEIRSDSAHADFGLS